MQAHQQPQSSTLKQIITYTAGGILIGVVIGGVVMVGCVANNVSYMITPGTPIHAHTAVGFGVAACKSLATDIATGIIKVGSAAGLTGLLGYGLYKKLSAHTDVVMPPGAPAIRRFHLS